MNLKDIRRVYCIGLGGVGVSAVAKYFLAHGIQVSGSDPVRSPIIDDVMKAGGQWFDEADAQRITREYQLVVYTDAARPDHPERQAAIALGIPTQNFSETMGVIMSTYHQRICVAGSNGKSTTSALTGLLLEKSGAQPTVFVGSRVTQFDGNLRLGHGNIFVAEADEYRDHFLHFAPTIAVVTNIELDHVDYFLNIERLKDSFTKFVSLVPLDGHVIYNIDDPISRRLLADVPNQLTFGLSEGADLRATDIVQEAGYQRFGVYLHGQHLGQYALPLPSTFNILNTLAAMAAALTAGADPSTFAQTIHAFHGVWRRFEILNPKAPVTIISDYAHHPTAVRGTITGAQAFYPNRRVVAVFQPHHHNRLTSLFTEFTKSFDAADHTVILETYAVPGREQDGQDRKTGKDLAEALLTQGKAVSYAPNIGTAQDELEKLLRPGDVALLMGAGDIWRIAEPLAQKYV